MDLNDCDVVVSWLYIFSNRTVKDLLCLSEGLLLTPIVWNKGRWMGRGKTPCKIDDVPTGRGCAVQILLLLF